MRLALLISFGWSLTAVACAAETPAAPEGAPDLEVRKAIVTPAAPASASAPATTAAPAPASPPAPAAAPSTSSTTPAAPAPTVTPAPAPPVMPVPAPGDTPDPEDEPKDGETVVKAVAVPEMMPLVPPTAPPVQPQEGKIVFTRCELQPPAIALTFDDGPHPDFTPKLLDTLKKENIKATFFLVGRCVNAYPNVVKRMVDEGHEIASHSWSHPLLTSLGDKSLDSQMQRTHDAIIKACGVTPTLYRPPYGATRLSQRKYIHDKFGYLAILWDVDPLDWQHPRTSKKVHDRIIEQTRIGSIILCHDIHETTVDAMPQTITDLKARGFQFLTVSQLIDLEKQAPALPNSPKLPPQAIAAMAAAAAPAVPAAPPKPVPPPKPAPKPMDTSQPLSLEAPGEIKL